MRRILCLLICMLLVAASAQAAGGFDTIPSREVFSMAYDRLQTAIARGRAVTWSAAVAPTAVGSLTEGPLGAMVEVLSGLTFDGAVQCGEESSHLEMRLLSGRSEVSSIGQVRQAERFGLNLTGEWISIANDMQGEAASMLSLDSFGQALLNMDFTGLQNGDIPILTAVYNEGIALWGLASPYSEDTNRLRVPSGNTGHAVIYEIDSTGLQTMLRKWVGQLEGKEDTLVFGFPGTELSFGIKEAEYAKFIEKARAFAQTAELSKPIKFSTTFGEGDLLRTAKGSGTLSYNGKRTGISYNYSCSPSSTRMTRKYSIDFQPSGADTLVATVTLLTSSNNKTSGAQEISANIKGNYDGQPYRIKVDINYVNRYDVEENGQLTEKITGTCKFLLEYGGRTVVDLSVKREGTTQSTTGLTSAIAIDETLDISAKNSEGVLFEGVVQLGLQVEEGPGSLPDVLAEARRLEDMDFMEIEVLRESLQDVVALAKQRLLEALPQSAMNVLK